MFTILLLGLFVFGPESARAFQSELRQVPSNDPYEALLPEDRGEVKNAVERIVSLHVQHRWDEVYDLLSDETHKSTSLSEYKRKQAQNHRQLIDFTPTSAKAVSEREAEWLVNGCARLDDRGRKAKRAAFVLITFKSPRTRIEFLVGLKKRGGPAACE